jgi:hypothetical protein
MLSARSRFSDVATDTAMATPEVSEARGSVTRLREHPTEAASTITVTAAFAVLIV